MGLVAQACLTLCDHMNCSPPGSFIHGILKARNLVWVAIPFSRGSAQPRDLSQVSHTAGRFFTIWTTEKPIHIHISITNAKNIKESRIIYCTAFPLEQIVWVTSCQWRILFKMMSNTSSHMRFLPIDQQTALSQLQKKSENLFFKWKNGTSAHSVGFYASI